MIARSLRVLAVLLYFFPFQGVLLSQITTATISGTIKDETGAVLPGVTLTVENQNTGIARSLVTDDEGRYTVAELPPGNYEVEAALAGFQTAVRAGVNLTVGRHAIVEIVMKVGTMDEKVVVSGEAPLVETTTSALAGLVGEQQIRDLPLNGRNFVQLTLLEPGVVEARTARTGSDIGGGLRISFHGARVDYNNFMMDGTSINSINQTAIGGSSGQALGVETIKEFQVLTSNFSAEFGRNGGGIINAVTKSGTNEFHGSLFYFHRNDNLDAANFFDSFDSATNQKRVPEFKRNQFGLTAGGPLRKDKMFIFGGYEGLREGLGRTLITNVPTAAARQGVLPGGAVTVDPRVKPYLDLYPLPNGRDLSDGTAELARADTDVARQDFFQIRVDNNPSDADSVFVRYTMDDSTKDLPQAIPTWLQTDRVRSQYVTIEEKRIISSTLLNVFRFGFNRGRVAYTQTPLDKRVFDRSLWFIPNGSVEGLGALGVSGLGEVGGAANRPKIRLDNVFQWIDTMSYNAGAHSLRVGTEVQRIQTNEFDTNRGQGVFSFANLRTFLLASPRSFDGTTAESDWTRGWRQTLLGVFFQDDIRVRRNLTLNLGIRWEFTTNPIEVNGKTAYLKNPTTDTNTIPGNPVMKLTKDNIAPRVGLSWDPFGNGKTSVRGGFGMFHQMIFRLYYFSNRFNPPFIQRAAAEAPNLSFPNPFAGQTTEQRLLDPIQFDNNKLPYMMQYNVSVQRELIRDTVLTVGYVGSRGLHLARFKDPNIAVPQILSDGRKFFPAGLRRRNPAWTQLRFKTLEASSAYNSMQLKLSRRVTQGLQGQVSYTWSHSTDDSSQELAGVLQNDNVLPQDPYDLKTEWGNSSFDVRQVFVLSSTYDVPLPRDRAGALGKFLQGWQINGILNVSTGVYFTIENSSALDQDRDQAASGSRPDLVAGRGNSSVLGGPDRYYDPGAFRLQEAGFYGNLGRNTVLGPRFATFDFALIKNTAISEGKNVQFRAEFFNLLNHSNFDLPNRTVFLTAAGIPSGSAGRITRTVTTSRQLQFGLKLTF